MNGRVAKMLRRVAFKAVTGQEKTGDLAWPPTQHVITNRGRQLTCAGFRAAYLRAKKRFKELKRGTTDVRPSPTRRCLRRKKKA
jgi:hypothetical protein